MKPSLQDMRSQLENLRTDLANQNLDDLQADIQRQNAINNLNSQPRSSNRERELG